MVYLPKRKSLLPALVVELKWDKSSEGAIQQIMEEEHSRERKYPTVLKNFDSEIVMVGINYDPKEKSHSCVIERV